jgi:hypothetical protein
MKSDLGTRREVFLARYSESFPWVSLYDKGRSSHVPHTKLISNFIDIYKYALSHSTYYFVKNPVTIQIRVQKYVTMEGQSDSVPWRQAPFGAQDQVRVAAKKLS